MIKKKGIAPAIVIALIAFGSSATAQPATQPKPQTTPAQPAAQPGPVNIPTGKVAVIFSAAFQDPKQGIGKFTVLLNKLNGEFQKTQADINQLQQRVQALQDEITKLQSSTTPVDPKTVQAKIDQLDQMKKDYQRKGEDAQAAYQKRRTEIFSPLQEDVGKALDIYAKSRGINLVIDGNQVEWLLFAADSIDITRAFINEYNLKNPVTASTATPK